MNKNNIDIKNIWQQQQVNQPDLEELMKKLRQFKNAGLRKLILSNILLIATSGFIVFIWYYYQPQLITTKIGLVLTILAIGIFLFFYNKLFSVFDRIDHTQTNNDYLHSLNTLKNKQKFLQTTMLSLYFIMLSAGICLYLFEYTCAMTSFWAVFTYAVTLIWIGFNWFYIRPKMIKKQQARLEELISKLEAVNKQFSEE